MKIFVRSQYKTTLYNVNSSDNILKLKQLIHDKLGIEPHDYKLSFGSKYLEEEHTFQDTGIEDYSTIHLLHRLHRLLGGSGGPLVSFEFQDLSKPIQKRKWSNSAPRWRVATWGLNLEGSCENILCEAHGKCPVIVMWGYQDFDFINDEHNCKCPICDKHVKPTTCGFANTKWKYEGLIKKSGYPPERINSIWKVAEDDGYTTFAENHTISWNSLVIRVKP
ncbi:16354_t:CDS:2 [Acaulospora morrowiae]|uniref:16354_t:CDS:1 n=1 Tax=Acaulospora morrowiae TaxID=94023 RepID=A0A9N8ZKU1_9GLOM|nr:16354_t:CDS:2 [Acaulospora morrowiae]